MSENANIKVDDAEELASSGNAAPADELGLEPHRIGEWFWLAVCTLIGAALRALNLDARPLWTDELTTIITAQRPLAESLTTAQDPQPPLHQLLVRLFTANAGGLPSEQLLRAPACLFGIATIPAAWWCARHFLGRVGAGIAALMIALNPLLVHHARDARPYALYVFFATLSITFFYRMVKAGGVANIVGYAIATIGMFFSHYYAMFFVAGQLAYAAIDFILGGPTRRRRWAVLIALVAAFLGSLPVLLVFLKLVTGGMQGSWWISKPGGIVEGFDAFGDLLGVRAIGVLCIIPLLSAFWLPRTWPWLRKLTRSTSAPPLPQGEDSLNRRAAAIEAGEGGVTESIASEPPSPRKRGVSIAENSTGFWVSWWLSKERAIYLALLVACALFLPLIGSLLVKPGWILRYSLAVAIPMLILGLAYLRSTGPVVTALVLAVLLGLSAPKALREMKPQQGLRDAVAAMRKNMAPSDAVFLPDWKFADDFILPEGLGVRYYGYGGPYASTHVDKLYAYVFGASKKLSKDEVDHILSHPQELLPAGVTWAICFHSTVNPVRDFLIKRGRLFEAWEFGLYGDGRTPMYTLIKIEPAEKRPSP